ncbi:MAG: TolC family protein [Candidatus Omnitrophica bacterium]|nr:TolC family protein [Candidatus Omnitrophota bacterium]
MTLDEAVSIALSANRGLLLKSEDLKKAKAMIAEARAGLLPSFTAKAGFTETRGLYSKDVGVTSGQIGVKQYIYTGGKVMNAVKSGEYSYAVAEAVLDRAKLETVLMTRKAFYAFLLADEYAAVNKGITGNTREHLDYINARFNAGEVSRSDVLKMRSSLDEVNRAYAASLSQVEAARETLKNILFIDKDVDLKISGAFYYEPVEMAYDEAFLDAMRQRPEIRQYEAQAKADEKNIEAVKADTRPSVYASWDYYSQSHLSAGTTRNPNDYNIIGVTVSWPIFDGWLTSAKVEQAIVDLRQTRLLSEKNIRDIALELKVAYLDLKNAIEEVKSVNSQNEVFRDNLAVIKDKYAAGQASGLELHDAQLSYDVSLFNKIQADYDYMIARAVFNKAQGGV